jgi:hypothetical protein
MLIFNMAGAGMGIVSLVLATSTNSDWAFLSLIFMDVPYRLQGRDEETSLTKALLAPSAGGNFFFIPCWIWGILFSIIIKVTKRSEEADRRLAGPTRLSG